MARQNTILVILLIVSLCANALMIGIGVGRKAVGPRPGPEARMEKPVGPGDLIRVLPPRLRLDVLREARRGSGGNLRGLARSSRDARIAVMEAATAKPFDEAALIEAGVMAQEADQQVAMRLTDALIAVLRDLTPEQRAQLRERWENREKRAQRIREFRRQTDRPQRDGAGAGSPQ